MVAATLSHALAAVEDPIPGSIPDPLLLSPGTGAPVITPQVGLHSPTSTESFMDQTLDDLLLSPMDAGPTQAWHVAPMAGHYYDEPLVTTAMFITFSEMLDYCLSHTAARITRNIKAEPMLPHRDHGM